MLYDLIYNKVYKYFLVHEKVATVLPDGINTEVGSFRFCSDKTLAEILNGEQFEICHTNDENKLFYDKVRK